MVYNTVRKSRCAFRKLPFGARYQLSSRTYVKATRRTYVSAFNSGTNADTFTGGTTGITNTSTSVIRFPAQSIH